MYRTKIFKMYSYSSLSILVDFLTCLADDQYQTIDREICDTL